MGVVGQVQGQGEGEEAGGYEGSEGQSVVRDEECEQVGSLGQAQGEAAAESEVNVPRDGHGGAGGAGA